ncbi:HAD family hydrolase [Janibacter corallicola]|uniref:HAD family hydrolase n=1 Tax=Janibacter corallicola TaxID=415212 RepID=UPI00082C30E0|nr:HAD-IA family hydrolase [Janibacter corallicola]
MPGPVRVLLWDCDGVLQHGRFDWRRRLDARVRPGFARRVFEAELPALRGERSLRDVLSQLLEEERREHGDPGVTLEDLLDLWEQFDVDPEAVDLLREVRAGGIRCLFATNQQDYRVEFMRRVGTYLDLVDGAYWSSRMGAMKPDRAFFEHIVADLGLPAHEIGFVDDVPANVEAARAVGIRAVRHDPMSGAQGLRETLRPLIGDR